MRTTEEFIKKIIQREKGHANERLHLQHYFLRAQYNPVKIP